MPQPRARLRQPDRLPHLHFLHFRQRHNGLAPTPRHTLYGLRHSMEDRMKEAGISDDLRRILLGHRIDREEYGIGGSLEWRQQELAKVALSFDPLVLRGLEFPIND